MPHTHTRTFRVRYSDCDAYGHLNSAAYLRFMQEAAFDGSKAAGYGQERYEALGRVWLVRESRVDFLCPIRYNDIIHVDTWVADFRRASSRRAYRFRFDSSGETAAEAYSDWVFLDTADLRPTGIPVEILQAFFPEGLPQSHPNRESFPQPPTPPEGAYRMRRRVDWHDIDSMQHVNNAQYMVYAGECAFRAVAHFGWPWQRMLAEGFAIYNRRAWLQYLQPALPEDELEICTWTYNVRRATAVRHYTIRRAGSGELLAQVSTTGVWVNVKTGAPVRIPRAMLADFSGNIAADSTGGF